MSQTQDVLDACAAFDAADEAYGLLRRAQKLLDEASRTHPPGAIGNDLWFQARHVADRAERLGRLVDDMADGEVDRLEGEAAGD